MNLNTLKETPLWEWPPGADKTLLAVLGDNRADPSERILAAELAGDLAVINDELAGAIRSIIQNADESEDLRCTAAISLGPTLEQTDIDLFEDPEAVPISEETFRDIQEKLHELFLDESVPKKVRRRILEASVRAPQDWHFDAVRAAYSGSDPSWRLTAVFCMRYIQGFDSQILESIESDDPDIHYEAVCAAGVWGLEKAWPHIAPLIASEKTEKSLLLAAIEAVATIRPEEASNILKHLRNAEDDDIAEAVNETIVLSGNLLDMEEDDEDYDKTIQ